LKDEHEKVKKSLGSSLRRAKEKKEEEVVKEEPKKEKDGGGGGGDGDNREFEWKRAMAAKEEIIQKLKKEVETSKRELEENKKKLKNLKQAPTNTSNDNILMLMKKVKKKLNFLPSLPPPTPTSEF